MKMKKLAMACGAALLGMSAVAQAEVSANIGVTSNYVWRGWTQTGDEAAVQGGIDYANDSGFYLGTWASNVDFGNLVDDAGAEVDFYGGFGGEVGEVGYDVGYIYYAYPQHNDSDFGEIYGSVSFQMVTLGLAYTTNSDFDSDGDIYYYGSVGFDLPQGFTIGATLGGYEFDDSTADSYMHYQLDIGKSAGDFGDFTLSVSDNDEAGSDPKVFVSWGKSF